MKNLVFILCIFSIASRTSGQAKEFGLVTFSEKEEKVLVYDLFMNSNYSVDIYHLYDDSSLPVLSIIREDSMYYEIDSDLIANPEYLAPDFFEVNSNLNKGRIVDPENLAHLHSLYTDGIEISEDVLYAVNFSNTEEHYPAKVDSMLVGPSLVKDIMVNLIYLNDTLYTYDIENIPVWTKDEYQEYLNDVYSHHRPYASYDESGILRGYSNYISYVFVDEKKDRVFVFCNFLVPQYQKWNFWTYEEISIRQIKYR